MSKSKCRSELKIVDKVCADSELYIDVGKLTVHRVSYGAKKTIKNSKHKLLKKRRRIIAVDKNGKNFTLVPVKFNDKCPEDTTPVSLLYCPPGISCCCTVSNASPAGFIVPD